MSVQKNLEYALAKGESTAIVEELLEMMGLQQFGHRMPDTLSGGQKQRIAIARTLLKNPKILILDDATSSVDVETEAQIHEALDHLMQGRTTFIIAHRIRSLMQADLILVLDDGKIIQQGIHKDLIHEHGKYKEIFDIQTKIDSALEKELGLA